MMEDNVEETSVELKTEEFEPPAEDLWLFLPDQVVLHIFQFLSGQQLSTVKQVCTTWHRIGCDELLWRDLLLKDYKIDKSIGLPPGKLMHLVEIFEVIINFAFKCYFFPTEKIIYLWHLSKSYKFVQDALHGWMSIFD
jgi:F-box-like